MAQNRHADRHDGVQSLDPFDRTLLDRRPFEWVFRPFAGFPHLFDDDTIRVEEFMDGSVLVVRAELPGVDPDRDVDISIVDGTLRIHAERREEHTERDRHQRRSELRYGSFSRTIVLPPGAKESEIKATYKDGLLEVRTPVDDRPKEESKVPIERR